MKTVLSLATSLFLLCSFGFSQNQTEVQNTWILQKIHTATQDISYVGDSKPYVLKLSASSLEYTGSCTPCRIAKTTFSDSKITYASELDCDPGCCFFDNPKQELAKFPRFEGTYILKNEQLIITSGDLEYTFGVK